MKIALIGATGFVGTQILKELLSRDHNVSAIVRDASKLTSTTNLISLQADINDIPALVKALQNQDAVVSAFNAGWTNSNLYNDFLKGAKNIQQAVKDAGVKRLIVIGGAGSLFIADGKQLVDSPEFPKDYFPGASSARDYLNLLKTETDIDWTFLSPSIQLKPSSAGSRTGKYRTALENPVMNEKGESEISVDDLAVAVVDELENPKHIQQRFTVGY